jgi:hypothetical protein
MTLQQLKEAIIQDETQFIIELYEDAKSEPYEIVEVLENMTDEVDSCQTVDELLGFFIDQGYSEREAYSHLFSYLVKN